MGRGSAGQVLPEGDGPVFLSRAERVQIYGVDTVESLEWKDGWTPGGEYVKKMVVKNVSNRVLKIRYKLPATKYFSMDFPEPVKLHPGMSHAVPVAFRPIKHERYDDWVEFVTEAGSFKVSIRALLPVVAIEVPPGLDFGFCPAKETYRRSFAFRNVGEVPVDFAWTVDPPFVLSPAMGRLLPGESQPMVAAFTPLDACVFAAQALCAVAGGGAAPMRVSGVSKYPHVALDTPSLEFGEVTTGQSAERRLRLTNSSLVPASYTARRLETDHDGVFSLSPTRGTIPPGGSAVLTAVYTPNASGTFSAERFVLSTPGGNAVTASLAGTAVGPAARLSAVSLDFGDVETGRTASHVLYLENASDGPLHFEVASDPGGVFRLDRAVGVVPARSTAHLAVTFAPTEPANYYKRVVVLLRDAAPLVFDALGTAFSASRRPPPFAQRHVDASRVRARLGLPWGASVPDASLPPAGMTELDLLSPSQVSDEFFFGDPAGCVTLAEPAVHFGACSRLRMSEYRAVHVTNHTAAKVTAFWPVPAEPPGPDGSPGAPLFAVFPETADIRPGATAEFRLAFRPHRDNFYFSRRLECVAYVKTMRNFRLVGDPERDFVVPWTLSVQATGHTFASGAQEFIPKAELSSPHVRFPPCHQGGVVYQTLAVVNRGDTPVDFEFAADRLNPAFRVWPAKGVVAAQMFGLVAFRFSPGAALAYADGLTCLLNNSAAHALTVRLTGSGHVPRVKLEGNGAAFFKPTCVGAATRREVALHNVSRIPVMFAWDIPPKLAAAFGVSPAAGLLRGNEILRCAFTFSPQLQKLYQGRIPVLISSPGRGVVAGLGLDGSHGGDAHTERLLLSVTAEGTVGAVAIAPAELSLGAACVGVAAVTSLSVSNQADGVLEYALEVIGVNSTGESVPWDSSLASISLDPDGGSIPGRSTQAVRLTVTPRRRGGLSFRIVARVLSGLRQTPSNPPESAAAVVESPSPREGDAPPPPASCAATAAAEYPQITVCDILCDGRPKAHLWRHCAISAINAELASVPREFECRLAAASGLVSTARALEGLVPFRVDMGAAAVGAPPTVLVLQLRNPGDLESSWAVALRNDARGDIDVENWVEEGEAPTAVDAAERAVLESRGLDVQPRAGTLAPGRTCTLVISVRHDAAGDHSVPLLLSVARGKRLRLDLVASTLPLTASRLVLPSGESEHLLQPVAIGDPSPPLQCVELRNDGPASLRYSVAQTPLDALTAESYGFEVLGCINPVGVVPPHGVALLSWRFQPLESRDYAVAVPISVDGGDAGLVLSLRARGYHPHVEGSGIPTAAEATDAADFAAVAPSPSLVVPWHLGAISPEIFHLGDLPAASTARRLVLVTNRTAGKLDFAWDAGLGHSPSLEGTLAVDPPTGRIDPGGAALCRVTYAAGARPQRWATDARCTLTPVFDADVDAETGETDTGATWPGFAPLEATGVLDDGELLAAQGTTFGRTMTAAARGDRAAQLAATSAAGEGLMRALATSGSFFPHAPRRPVAAAMTKSLRAQKPPLEALHVAAMARLVADRAEATRLTPPRPTVCFLRVSACALSQEAYRAKYGDDAYASCWVPLANRATPAGGAAMGQQQQPPPALSESGAAVAAIASRLLLDALRDPALPRAFAATPMEETPFYLQLRGGIAAAAGGGGAEETAEDDRAAAAEAWGESAADFVAAEGAAAAADAANAASGLRPPPSAESSGDAGLESVTHANHGLESVARAAAEAGFETRVLASPEVTELLEGVLEGTLFNLMRESLDPAVDWDVGGGQPL